MDGLCFILFYSSFFFQAGVLISIIWNSEWEICLLFSLYLVFHSILLISVDTWVYILYLGLFSSTSTFFLLLRLFQLWSQGLLYPLPYPYFFEHFFTFRTIRCSRLIMYFPCFSPKISLFFKVLWFLLREDGAGHRGNEVRSVLLGCPCVEVLSDGTARTYMCVY